MSNIEWTGKTWNPISGCSRKSAGCENCYAETMTGRLAAMGQEKYQGLLNEHGRFNGIIKFDEKALLLPLSIKKPTVFFVNSMSDLFHENVKSEWVDQIFAVMSLTPQHTYQILTKRADRMKEYLPQLFKYQGYLNDYWLGDSIESRFGNSIPQIRDTRLDRVLPNVWLGVSVENQKAADERIPLLLDTPAAIRFLSCEPLLGKIDLSKWMPQRGPFNEINCPEKWVDFQWQEWVPAELVKQIESFWTENIGRSPQRYLEDIRCLKYNTHSCPPAFGETVTMPFGCGENKQMITGRYVHAWNNIGRVVREDGSYEVVSFFGRNYPKISWVIAGGESGHSARACHLEWISNIVYQCQSAGVSCFVKQLGGFPVVENINLYDFPEHVKLSAWGNKAASFSAHLKNKKGGDISEFPADLQIRQFPK